MFKISSFKIIDWLLVIVLVAGFSLQLYLLYYGYIIYNFLVPPGSDAISHYNIIKQILDTGSINFLTYPPGFHLLVILLSQISHVQPFDILTYWTPALVVLPSLAMYFLLRQLFDHKTSTLTTLIFLLTSGYPLYGFIDGNYPDILAYGVFAILLFAFIIRYLKTKNTINLIIAGVFLVLIAFTHHLTFVSIAVILIIFGLVQLYILLVEKRLKVNFSHWKFLATASGFILILLSLFLAVKIYGPIIIRFINGFLNNNPAVQDKYLNMLPNWPDYALMAGNPIWYLGVFGLLFLLVTTFKERREIGAKQLVLVWITFYFLMSRLGATGFPARFARELAPALTVCIGFLLNYIFNLNSLRIHRYKMIFGYGLIGFLIITNSAIYVGPARIPDSFKLMVWFLPKDQEILNFINSNVQIRYQILYNPFANLYIPIKTTDNWNPILLDSDQLALAQMTYKNDNYHYHGYENLSLASRKKLTGYEKMIYDLSKQYGNYKYVYVGNLPPSNPDPTVYPKYAQFDIYKKVLYDLSSNGDLVKKFSDGSLLIKMY